MGDVLDRCARVLVTSLAALDAAPDTWAGNVRHVGPVLEGPGADAGWRPPAGGDGRPLVVVSLGTTPMGEAPVLQRVLDALAGEPVTVLALLGAHLDPADLRLPANAVTSGYVRHAAVLPHAAVTVCHGGLGTVLASLAAGVPVVCLPLGREQPDNAAAAERAGAGRTVDPAAGPDAIREAVTAVRDDPAYRRAAADLAATMAAPGATTAAEDEVLSLLQPR
jgi:MGT family glycosyltransferase